MSDTREQKVPLFPQIENEKWHIFDPPTPPHPKKEKIKKGKRSKGEREEKRVEERGVLNGRSPAEGPTEARLNGFQEAR